MFKFIVDSFVLFYICVFQPYTLQHKLKAANPNFNIFTSGSTLFQNEKTKIMVYQMLFCIEFVFCIASLISMNTISFLDKKYFMILGLELFFTILFMWFVSFLILIPVFFCLLPFSCFINLIHNKSEIKYFLKNLNDLHQISVFIYFGTLISFTKAITFKNYHLQKYIKFYLSVIGIIDIILLLTDFIIMPEIRKISFIFVIFIIILFFINYRIFTWLFSSIKMLYLYYLYKNHEHDIDPKKLPYYFEQIFYLPIPYIKKVFLQYYQNRNEIFWQQMEYIHKFTSLFDLKYQILFQIYLKKFNNCSSVADIIFFQS